jgi:hypothetical protein
VTGAGNTTITMPAVSITPPVDAAQTTAYCTTRDGKGAAVGGISLSFRLVDPTGSVDAWDRSTFTATSDGSGLLQVALVKSSSYEGRRGTGPWVPFTTGSASTYQLPEILSNLATG